jgi:ribose transport system substrate-binding protein
VTAISEAGLKDKIKVISIDRDSATLEDVKNGDIYSTVAGKQYTEVYYGVKICYDFQHGSKKAFSNDDASANIVIAPSFVDTGSLIINKDNVDKFIGFSYAK